MMPTNRAGVGPRASRAVAVAAIVIAAGAACADRSSTMSTTAPVVTARAAGLELAVSAHGTVLHVVLRNRGETPLRIAGPVDAPDGRYHDFLHAELTGAAVRTLRFTGDRNSSTTGIVDLAPGAELADDLDLAIWARAELNGAAPLAAGDYRVQVIYTVRQPDLWAGTISAGPVELHAP